MIPSGAISLVFWGLAILYSFYHYPSVNKRFAAHMAFNFNTILQTVLLRSEAPILVFAFTMFV